MELIGSVFRKYFQDVILAKALIMNQTCNRQLKLDGNENHQIHCRWIHSTDDK